MKKVLLYLLLTITLYGQELVYDTTEDIDKYLEHKERIKNRLEKDSEKKPRATGKKFLIYQKDRISLKWARIDIEDVDEVELIINYYRDWRDIKKGYRIYGMYYLFYAIDYPCILKRENENNRFTVFSYHTMFKGKIDPYYCIFVCVMNIEQRQPSKSELERGIKGPIEYKILNFYRQEMLPWGETGLKMREYWEFSIIIAKELK